jgi:hypothetical protein
MANERKRIAGELSAWQVSEIVARVTGEQLDPGTINPYRKREVVEVASKENTPASKARFWNAVGALFGDD